MFKKLRISKKASIEIGINTIVIMVIAIVLLGLGVGFVKGIFAKMGGLTDTISIDDMSNPPTASDPLRINPVEVSVKSGEGKPVQIGVYNKGDGDGKYAVAVGACKSSTVDAITPTMITLDQDVPTGEAGAFKTTLYAKDTNKDMIVGDYICPLTATSGSATYSTQFYLTVTA